MCSHAYRAVRGALCRRAAWALSNVVSDPPASRALCAPLLLRALRAVEGALGSTSLTEREDAERIGTLGEGLSRRARCLIVLDNPWNTAYWQGPGINHTEIGKGQGARGSAC